MSKTLLAQARLAACRKRPFASHAILSLVPVERKGLGTCAIDQFWRLYYCPDFLASVTPSEAAGVILHEVDHLLLRHHKRAEQLVPLSDQTMGGLWNQATDCAINQQLRREGIKLPEGCLYPETLNLEPGKAAEHYYHELRKRQEEKNDRASTNDSGGSDEDAGGSGGDDGEGGGEPAQCDGGADFDAEQDDGQSEAGAGNASSNGCSDGADAGTGKDNSGSDGGVQAVSPGQSGSCADGQQRPWELGPPDEQADASSAAPGLDDHEQQQIIRQVAQAIEKSKGTGAGYYQEMVDGILRPKIDPRRLLMRAVQCHTENILAGSGGRFTYRRPARRPSFGGLIRPRSFRPVPRILVIIDTSGSMDRDDLQLAGGLVAKVLSGLNLRDGVRVICGDTRVQSDMQIFDASKIELRGRGGTEMDMLLQHAAELPERERCELAIVVSDGYTDWPRERMPFPVVAALTRDPAAYRRPPAWIDTVQLLT